MNARTKLIGTIAVGAALLAPVAQAQSPDYRAGLRGPGGIAAQQAGGASSHPDNRAVRGTGVAVPTTNLAVRPDDRAGTRGPGALAAATLVTGAISHPDNRAEPRGPGSVDRVVVLSGSSRFDWADASIGSLGGIGFALLLMGCVYLLASQRNKTRLV
jgi:hypothetical protein